MLSFTHFKEMHLYQIILFLFSPYFHFLSEYLPASMSMHHVCAMPLKARRGHRYPGTRVERLTSQPPHECCELKLSPL